MDPSLLTGTLEVIILDVLSQEPSYGYAITQTVLLRSQGAFELKEGSLYPALHRLEQRKLLSSYWVDTEEGRRRKYYRLTAEGAKALAAKRKEWLHFAGVINRVLGGDAHAVAPAH